ncbi:MAG: 3-isopropylmalate dehydratase small subunit [Elusimicrobia bacterium HGW-Elusimicrobia-4]|nr:MAG: 3-isopropylmalate dehydratase small subunit [Elusimicrobia bacterium HGW-Elusimicrobia-4]
MILKGKAHKYLDNVNTDEIIPARYLNTADPDELAKHCMEDIDGDFVKNVADGDIIVAGKNFGCGSSREHAPLSIKAAGISCVIAESFARIFFRNAINIGLPILEVKDTSKIMTGDELEVNLTKGTISNLTKHVIYSSSPFLGFLLKIIDSGGLMNYIKKWE